MDPQIDHLQPGPYVFGQGHIFFVLQQTVEM